MIRADILEIINNNPERYLQLAKDSKSYICPLCSSGSGKNGSGITTKDNIHYTCWRGCFSNSDIVDIIGLEYNIENYNEKLAKACEIFGLSSDNVIAEPKARAEKKQEPEQPTEAEDYTTLFLEANKNLEQTSYYSERGLSRETADYFKLGYIENWKHPKAEKAPESPRLIIPTSKHSYIARDIRQELTEQQAAYAKSKVGNVHIFNEKAIKTAAEPVFIVEGELDAMSLYELGGQAVGLGGISNIKKFIEAATQEPQKQPYIIALDNDSAGQEAAAKLAELMKEKGLLFTEYNIQGQYKDANEALQKDREALRSKMIEAKEQALKPAGLDEYEAQNQAAAYIETMRAELEKEAKLPTISTGFKGIDSIINGGLYAGLYFIGAISSLGKTTLALQIADNIAKQEQDILIISLEMAKRELIAKSISRLTAEYSQHTTGLVKKLGQSTADIMNLKRQQGYYDDAGTWQQFTAEKQKETAAVIDTAFKRYSEYAKHIFIYEGIGDITPERIREKIQQHKAIYGKAPTVIIDYLQILQGDNSRDNDKMKTDKNVTELKRISRDYNIPVIAISSVNRSSYNEPISMESFKESGGIEYSSDILIGLQYKGMDYSTDASGKREKEPERLSRISELTKELRAKASAGEPQAIEIKILKNRNGNRGTAELNFYPMYNYFTEALNPIAERRKLLNKI